MAGFSFLGSSVKCDGVDLSTIADREGTPVYVYSRRCLEQRYTALADSLRGHTHRIHYALKANSTFGLVQVIQELGSGVDANSGSEISVALRAGFSPEDVVFTGVGKTQTELELALSLGVDTINAESSGELDRIDLLARARGIQARVAVRVNPDVDAESHPGISTGSRSHKFGVPIERARDVCLEAARRDGLKLVGLHAHIGSQIVNLDPIRRTAKIIVDFARELRSDGIVLEQLDLGGGLGISYDGANVLSVEDYASSILREVVPSGLKLLVEPGRWIVGPSGALVTRVVDVKHHMENRYFVIVDAGMSEFMRPALYDSFHRVDLLSSRQEPKVECDIVGPICESTDVLALRRLMPLPVVGDLIAVRDVGAYGSAMASNYNRHSLPAEVLVDTDGWRLIRRRQTVDDLLSCETKSATVGGSGAFSSKTDRSGSISPGGLAE